MKNRKFLIATIIVVTIGAISLTACGRHHHDPEDKAEWMVHKISNKLDLDEVQEAKLEDVKSEIMKFHDQHRANKAQTMDKLILEIQKPQIDDAFLLDLVNQHASRVQVAAPTVIEKLVIFHASLNAEQKEEMVEKLQKFKKYHDKHDS